MTDEEPVDRMTDHDRLLHDDLPAGARQSHPADSGIFTHGIFPKDDDIDGRRVSSRTGADSPRAKCRPNRAAPRPPKKFASTALIGAFQAPDIITP